MSEQGNAVRSRAAPPAPQKHGGTCHLIDIVPELIILPPSFCSRLAVVAATENASESWVAAEATGLIAA